MVVSFPEFPKKEEQGEEATAEPEVGVTVFCQA